MYSSSNNSKSLSRRKPARLQSSSTHLIQRFQCGFLSSPQRWIINRAICVDVINLVRALSIGLISDCLRYAFHRLFHKVYDQQMHSFMLQQATFVPIGSRTIGDCPLIAVTTSDHLSLVVGVLVKISVLFRWPHPSICCVS